MSPPPAPSRVAVSDSQPFGFSARPRPSAASALRRGVRDEVAVPARRVALVAVCLILLIGGMEAWNVRHTLSPDGVSYLDLSDAIVSGRWAGGGLLNAYWSPLYPALLGVLRRALQPTALGAPYWEFTVVHVLNVLLLALSAVAFGCFLRELMSWMRQRHDGPAEPLWFHGAAWALFAATALGMIGVAAPTPDMLVNAIVYAAFAALLRVDREPAARGRAAPLLFGALLGAGVLAKSFLLPFSILVLSFAAVAWLPRRGARALRSAIGAWTVVVLPWCLALSLSVGHVTVGETGRLAYAWYVNNQQPPNTGALPDAVQPRGLERAVLPELGVTGIAPGTNPVWYDPARWNAGLHVRWKLADQMKTLEWWLRYYAAVLAPLLFCAAVLIALCPPAALRKSIAESWLIVMPCVAALGAYALVYSALRYIAPFVTILGLMLVAMLVPRPPASSGAHGRPSIVAATMSVSLVALTLTASSHPLMTSVTIGAAVAVAIVIALQNRPIPERAALALAGSLAVIAALRQLPSAYAPWLGAAAGALTWIVWRTASPAATAADGVGRGERGGIGHLAAWTLVASMVLAFSVRVVLDGYATMRDLATTKPEGQVHPFWTIARALRQAGVAPGSPVAIVGSPDDAYWARLNRLHFTAIVPDRAVGAFWELTEAERAIVLDAMWRSGARFVIATRAPRSLPPAWVPVAGGAVLAASARR